jgi:CysZ protein
LIAISALGALLFAAGFVPSSVKLSFRLGNLRRLDPEYRTRRLGLRTPRMLRLADRRAAMRRRRIRVLGFAVRTFLLLAIPLAGAVVFPIATAEARCSLDN